MSARTSLAAKAPEERRRRILAAAVEVLKDKGFDPLLPLPALDESLWGKEGEENLRRRREQLGQQLRDYPHSTGYFTGPMERTFVTSLQFVPLCARA
jgi:hypothetical protein